MTKHRKNLYCQCNLEKPTKKGCIIMTSFLPIQYSEVGKILKLKNERDEWENG